jgi:hypothetical protein
MTPLLLWGRNDDVWRGGTARDDEASTPGAGCCYITQPSSRITDTLGARSGVDAG